MSATREYKRTRSGGVLALRPGNEIAGFTPIRQDWEGVSPVTENTVWRTSLLGGRTILIDSTDGFGYRKAVRVQDPVEGSILWINENDETSRVWIRLSARSYVENLDKPVYVASYDFPGELDGEPSYPAVRIHMEDGTSFITYEPPA